MKLQATFLVSVIALSFSISATPTLAKQKAKAAAPKAAAKAAPSPLKAVEPRKESEAKPVFKRLDPHGSATLKLKEMKLAEHSECKVCHVEEAGTIKTKPEPGNLCAACHGRLPHSGVLEHMGEESGGGAGLDCLGCHRAHRAPGESSPAEADLKKSSFIKRSQTKLPDGLVDKSTPGIMIDHPCSECHSF